MVKHGISSLLPCLAKIFNMVYDSGSYPEEWSEGYLSTIYKSGNQEDPSNYRGICIMSAIGKLFNSVLNKRLETFLKERNVINPVQIGFCKGTRTTDHMFILKCIVFLSSVGFSREKDWL